MKNVISTIFLGLSLMILSICAVSKEVALQPTKTFPVSKNLLLNSGEPLSVLETAQITDEAGQLARGLHEVTFNLDAASPYAVIVDGHTVNPGESIIFTKNLTMSGSKLNVPIYPAVSGVEGVANYSVNIPVIKVKVCNDGDVEVEDGCLNVTIDTMTIECPVDYLSDTNDGIACFNYTEQPIILECETGFGLEEASCIRRTIIPAEYNCDAYPGLVPVGDKCVMALEKPATGSCESGQVEHEGQCRLTENVVPASLLCPQNYVSTNGQCIKNTEYPSIAACRSGFENVEIGCVMIGNLSNPYICPVSHYYSDGSCYPSMGGGSVVAASCDGLSEYNGRCYETSNLAQYTNQCNTGDTLDASGQLCIKKQVNPGQYTCPNEYTLESNSCYKYLYSEMSYSCLQGGEFNPTQKNCTELESLTKPVSKCDAGWVVVGGQCRRDSSSYNATYGCTSGVWNGSNCEVVSTGLSSVICQLGQVMSGKDFAGNGHGGGKGYYSTDSVSYIQADIAGSTCHDATSPTTTLQGWEVDWEDDGVWRAGSTIVKVESNQSVPCPSNLPLRDGIRCWKNATEKNRGLYGYVGKTASNSICPSGYTFNYFHENGYLNSDHQCVKNSGTPLTMQYGRCQNATYTYSSSTGRCTKQTLTGQTYSCPSGGTLNGSSCKTYDYSAQGNFCNEGGEFRAVNNACEIDINELAGRNCLTDFNMEPDGESCKKVEEYEFVNCADPTYTPDADMSICERILFEEPTIICEAGFEPDEANVQCVKTIKNDFAW